MDFDYYQIKGKWNAATLNRRAEKLEEAQAAADELEEAGAKGVEIIGVKAGKRETIRGKKKPAKPTKTTKAAKVQAKEKKPAKAAKKQKDKLSKMSADDLNAINSIFSHDGKIKILKTNTPKHEPTGQLDLFTDEKPKSFLFSNRELKAIFSALSSYGSKDFRERELEKCFERAAGRGGNIQISLNGNERVRILNALKKRLKDERDPMHDVFLTLINDLV